MSRRKQGRPQQRKTLDSLEQENDLLVCGDCQTSFPLRNIVHFIRHKKQCCDKENLDSPDGACRKPGSGGGGGGNNEITGDRNKDDDDDNDEESTDLPESSSRKDGSDETGEEGDNENDEHSVDSSGSRNLANGEKKEGPKKEEKDGKKDEREKTSSSLSSCREVRAPLRQKQVVDAESNTVHSEPSRFVCETCRSTYTSAWALLQHAQKEHGMKIYTSPTNQHQHSPSSASTPIPNTVSPMDLVVASSPRSSLDHRSVSAGSGGSVSPYPVHTPNPFASPFRLPIDSRLSHPSSLSPFSRSPNFDFDVISDCRLRPQLLTRAPSALDHPLFSHGPFDRTRPHMTPALDYDYYSMRLKQLASSPVVSQAKSQFPPSCPPHPPSVAVTPTSFKSESPPAEASSASPVGGNLTSALTLPPKQKACEFCGKTFRFQSNLVVHRRSHTGEKPYKCPHCPHACTQQSKLKRHMKTHSQKTDGEVSPGGTSNHKEGGDCVNDDDDNADDVEDDEEEEEEEDEEEEEECEEDEDMIEEEMNEEEREVLNRMKNTKNGEELAPEPGEIRHDAKRIKLEHRSENKEEEDTLPSDLSMKSKPPPESLLSEVMKRTGLNDIQTYSEAYKAALAESQESGKEKGEDKNNVKSSGRDEVDSPRTASPRSPRPTLKRELESEKESDKDDHKEHLYLGGTDLLSKSSKRDSSTSSLWPSGVESLPSNNIDSATASLYSRLQHSWFPSDNHLRFFFPGYPRFPPTPDLTLTSESHNGLNLSPSVATTSSALKSDNPSIPALFKSGLTSQSGYSSPLHRGTSGSSSSPTGSLLLPSNGNSVITPPRKENRRNDTCEFCGKIFKNCSNLTVHRRSHTGEKPYKCNLCSYACAQSSKLTRHMKTHGRLGKDVYTCKFCNMPFSVPSTLEKHMRKCVENRNARLVSADVGDLSSESNGEMSRQSDSASGVY